jgi:hypothetical protein
MPAPGAGEIVLDVLAFPVNPGDLVASLHCANWGQCRRINGDDAIPLPADLAPWLRRRCCASSGRFATPCHGKTKKRRTEEN